MSQTISVVLAVYNEEENLDECLESVKDFADEIVIVDGGSNDETVTIAKRFKAKIIETNNPPIFHINKNKAIEAASCDWILQLDADERVTKELFKEIREVINSGIDLNGYWVPRSNLFLTRFLKKGGQYPDYTLRLYRKGKGILPAKDVHEQAVVEGGVGYLKQDLVHLRDTSFTKYINGLNRYTDLIATQLQDSKIKTGFFSSLEYFVFKPIWWFLWTYFRHKGFMDGFPGFVFALFSALRFPIAYTKFWVSRKGKK